MINQWRRLLRGTYNTYSVYRSTRNAYISEQIHSGMVPTSSPEVSLEESNPEVSLKESPFLEPEEVPPLPARLPEADVSVLEEQKVLTDVSDVGPPLDFKAFNFAAFVNESEVLKKFVDLEVDFYTLERKNPVPSYLISLDLDKDIAPRIQFLLDHGLTVDDLGRFITKNPYFFMNSLSDLQVRINYLESKRFDRDAITILIRNNPRWLNYPTVEVDRRLGFFQRELRMTGREVRLMLINYPQILNTHEVYVKQTLFELQNVQEFTLGQCKKIFISYPQVWIVPIEKLKDRLEYIMNEMKIPTRLIVADPIALVNSRLKLQNRHTFLKCLGRAQYDPKEPNYVSLSAICMGDDAQFCREVAKTAVETYNLYLKTL